MTNEETLQNFFELYEAELAAIDLLEDGLVAAIEDYDEAKTADVLLTASEQIKSFCRAIEKACTDIGIVADKVVRRSGRKTQLLTVSPRPHGFAALSSLKGNIQAPEGAHWVCGACGKKSKWKYGFDAQEKDCADYGWDESCMMNCALIEDEVKE